MGRGGDIPAQEECPGSPKEFISRPAHSKRLVLRPRPSDSQARKAFAFTCVAIVPTHVLIIWTVGVSRYPREHL